MTFVELIAAVDGLAEHPAFTPYLVELPRGLVVIDGQVNVQQLKLITAWLEQEERNG